MIKLSVTENKHLTYRRSRGTKAKELFTHISLSFTFYATLLSMQQENNNLRFTPSSNEQSPELQKLFADITVQIDNFCQGNTSVPRVLINRFVAGHICHDDIEELPLAFVAPKTKAPVPSRDLTSWQKFVAIQQQNQGASDLGGAGKFAGTSRLALEWQNLTQEERDSFKDTEIVSKRKQKKRKVDDLGVDDGTTIKSHQYNAAMKAFKTNINAMLQNFGTHIILIAVTDTRQTHLYPPVVLPNSGKDIFFPIINECVSDQAREN